MPVLNGRCYQHYYTNEEIEIQWDQTIPSNTINYKESDFNPA